MLLMLLPFVFAGAWLYALLLYAFTAQYLIGRYRAHSVQLWSTAACLAWPVILTALIVASFFYLPAETILPLYLLGLLVIPAGVIAQYFVFYLMDRPSLRFEKLLPAVRPYFSSPVIWGAVPTLSLLAFYLIDYLGGRSGMPLILPPILPLGLVPMVTGLVGFIVVPALVLKALVRRDRILRHLVILVLALGLPYLIRGTFKTLELRPFLAGFRARIFAAGTTAEFRNAAKAIVELVPEDSQVPNPKFGAQEGPTWNKLLAIPCIKNLGPWVRIYRRDGTVVFVWGGALMGHWGFRVGPNASTSTPNNPTRLIPFEPDFVFYLDPN